MVQKREIIPAQYTWLIVKAAKKHTNNMASRTVTMRNKELGQKLKCSVCLSDKSRFLK